MLNVIILRCSLLGVLAHNMCVHVLPDFDMIYPQDLSTSEVLYDEAFKSLEIAMKGLVQPVSQDLLAR